MATITTGVTQLTDEGPVYRGRRAVDLATSAAFEEVAALLWRQVDTGPVWEPVDLGAPPEIGPSDRMRWAVVMAGARDPLRADLRLSSGRPTTARRPPPPMPDHIPTTRSCWPTDAVVPAR